MTSSKFLLPAVLAVISIILFFIFRFSNIEAIPVFVDEAIYVRWSQVMRSEPSLRFLPLSDGKQPLFMWATIPMFKIIEDPLVAGRTLSILAGLGSLVGLGILTYLLFENVLVAVFASFVYAILPFTVFFDRMALADSLLAMFGVYALIFAIKFIKTLRPEHAIFMGFAIGGALLTKSPATIFYLWSALAILFLSKKEHRKTKNIITILWGVLLAVVISQAMYSILRLGTGFHMIGARNMDYVYSLGEAISHPLVPLVENLRRTSVWFWFLLTPSVLFAIILALLNSKSRRPMLLLLICSLAPLVAQGFIAKVYTSRYILYAIYPLIPLAGYGFYWMSTRKGLIIKLLLPIFLIVPLVLSWLYVFSPAGAPLPFDMRSGYLEEWTAGIGQKAVAEYLIQEASKGNKIVVFTEGTFGTLPDGLQIYTEGLRDITIVGSSPNIFEIPEGLLNTDTNNLRYFVLNSSRNHLPESELEKLELINEYPKPVRSDGTQEILLLYRLK